MPYVLIKALFNPRVVSVMYDIQGLEVLHIMLNNAVVTIVLLRGVQS